MLNPYLPLIVTFSVYFVILLIIGFIANHTTRNLSDFVLAGRRLSGTIAALGAGASDMGAWLLLGLPGAVYALGINQIWLPIGLTIGAYLNWRLVASRLRIYTEVAQDSLTIPAFFDHRFHDKTRLLRIVTAVSILIFFTFYSASGLVSGAVLFQTAFDLNYEIALWMVTAAIVTYTIIGGFLAVSWTDFLQGCLMFVALIVTPITAAMHLGDWSSIMGTINSINPTYLDAFSGITVLGTLSLLAWGLGYFGQPHILVRFMAVRHSSEIPKAGFICMTWMILSLYGAVFVGFLGIAYFASHPLSNPETVFLEFAQLLFNPWVAGILLAAVLSAIMGNIAAQLLASSSALTEDIYRGFIRKKASPKELILVSRLTVFGVACIALFLAHNPQSSVLKLVSFAWAGLGSAFGAVVLFSLFWSRVTRNGAIAGIILGTVTVIVWKQLAIYGGIFTLYEMVPGFIVSSLGIIIVSLLGNPPEQAILDDYEIFTQRMKQAP